MHKLIVEPNLSWTIIVSLGNSWWYETARVALKVTEVSKKSLTEPYCTIIINITLSKFVELEVTKANKY